MAGSSRGRSSSPSRNRKPSSPFSSTSSSSSLMNGRLLPCSCSSSVTSICGGVGEGYGSRSMAPSLSMGDNHLSQTSESYPSVEDQLVGEPVDYTSKAGDSISVTIRFRPMSEREYQRGEEIAWYADSEKLVRNEYNPMTAYVFNRVFGPNTITEEVYEVVARPVVKAAMEGINGTVFAYGVTSSGKTHTMHGDQDSPCIIPLAIKDVFSLNNQLKVMLLSSEKLDVLRDGSVILDGENKKDSSSSTLSIPSDAYRFKHRRSSSKWNDDISQAGSTIIETTQASELISGSSCAPIVPIDDITMSGHMDLLVEQVKMLAGDITFGTSTLKRLIEQSVNDPESSRTQIENYVECAGTTQQSTYGVGNYGSLMSSHQRDIERAREEGRAQGHAEGRVEIQNKLDEVLA